MLILSALDARAEKLYNKEKRRVQETNSDVDYCDKTVSRHHYL